MSIEAILMSIIGIGIIVYMFKVEIKKKKEEAFIAGQEYNKALKENDLNVTSATKRTKDQ